MPASGAVGDIYKNYNLNLTFVQRRWIMMPQERRRTLKTALDGEAGRGKDCGLRV